MDWLLDKPHDLSNPLRQQSLHDQLSEVDFICAAFDCSTKSRAREIPRRFEDGRPCPAPLRSEQHPDGLPTLQGRDLQRVCADNQACEFILEEIRLLAERGGGSVRENPWRSLHWWGPTERSMMDAGHWRDRRGLANFFEQGVYGRIGCGGLHAIKERQLVRGDQMTPAIEQCFQILEAVISIHPERELDVWPRHHERFVAASDAALETPGEGAGGFLLVFFHEAVEIRLGFVSHLPSSIYDLWTPGDAKIAQLELLQVLIALTTTPERFRNRRGTWYIDNTAALMALIKGRSDSPDLEHMSHMIHILLFSLRCSIYFEWIPSKSNWSDAISREGHADRWHHDQGFTSRVATFFEPLWYFPFSVTLRVGLFL